MKRDLETAIADIRSGRSPSALLLFGDDFQVQEFCHRIVDAIVPENQRAFNLERFDGRSAAWDRIEASLATPPFLPGRKLVWVENAPYFLSREQKSELGEKVLQHWTEGKKEEAGKLLLDLLSVEGWSNDQWERVQSGSSLAALVALLGADGGEEVEPLIDYCKNRGLDFAAAARPEGHGLLKLLDEGLPPWDLLLLTAIQVDRRTRLYKRFEEMGAALYVDLERDRSGRLTRENLLEFINQRLGQAGKTMGPREREMILLRTGDNLRGLQHELEKLFLYMGDRPAVRVQDLEAILTDQGEGWIFDLTHAIADRDVVAALSHLGRLLAQGEHALKLLATMASEIRKLLTARQLIDGELRGRWKPNMTYQQFQQTVIRNESSLLLRNPYADYMCFQRAEKFSLETLRFCLALIYDTDLRLKSSGNQPQLVMERLILSMCLGTRSDTHSRDLRPRS
jgi:DNA polymerase III delta subunit